MSDPKRGQGETQVSVKEKLTKGLDVMQNKKENPKTRNNKEEENSWVPGKKN